MIYRRIGSAWNDVKQLSSPEMEVASGELLVVIALEARSLELIKTAFVFPGEILENLRR